MADTVGSHLFKLHLSEHISYPNAFSKAIPTTSDYFHRQEAVQITNIEGFSARSIRCMAPKDAG